MADSSSDAFGTSLGVMARDSQADDVLPRRTKPIESALADASDVRLAYRDDALSVYIARGARDGEVCLLVFRNASPIYELVCGPVDALSSNAIGIAFEQSSDAGLVAVGIVSDGVRRVYGESESARLGNNVFVLRYGTSDESFTMENADGRQLTFPLSQRPHATIDTPPSTGSTSYESP